MRLSRFIESLFSSVALVKHSKSFLKHKEAVNLYPSRTYSTDCSNNVLENSTAVSKFLNYNNICNMEDKSDKSVDSFDEKTSGNPSDDDPKRDDPSDDDAKLGDQESDGDKPKSQPKKKKRKVSKGDDEGGRSTGNRGMKRPNYFVAFQVDDEEIHANATKVQEEILSKQPLLRDTFVKLPTLHITFLVMHLHDDDDMAKAMKALDCCHEKLSESFLKEPLNVTFSGLGHFKNETVFAKIKDEEDCLQKLQGTAEIIHKCMEENGVAITDKKGFEPHMTILKLSKLSDKLKKKGIKKIDPEFYSDSTDLEFGTQLVKDIHLAAMNKPKDEKGYYCCSKVVLLRNSGPILQQNQDITQKKDEVKRKFSSAASAALENLSIGAQGSEADGNAELVEKQENKTETEQVVPLEPPATVMEQNNETIDQLLKVENQSLQQMHDPESCEGRKEQTAQEPERIEKQADLKTEESSLLGSYTAEKQDDEKQVPEEKTDEEKPAAPNAASLKNEASASEGQAERAAIIQINNEAVDQLTTKCAKPIEHQPQASLVEDEKQRLIPRPAVKDDSGGCCGRCTLM